MAGWHPSRHSRAQLEERRLAATEWIQRGTDSHGEIAAFFGVSVFTVQNWVKRLKRRGTLLATVTTGRPARLSGTQHEQLRTLLRKGACHHGFPDETWTTRRVTDVVARHFEVWYHHEHVLKLLRQLGFTS